MGPWGHGVSDTPYPCEKYTLNGLAPCTFGVMASSSIQNKAVYIYIYMCVSITRKMTEIEELKLSNHKHWSHVSSNKTWNLLVWRYAFFGLITLCEEAQSFRKKIPTTKETRHRVAAVWCIQCILV